jgi:amino acid transporter
VTHYRSLEAALPGTPIVSQVESTSFLNAPVAYVLHVIDQDWAAGLISAGAVAGITSVLLVMLMGQPRIFFSMSRDRLLPPGVSRVHPRFGTPYITTIITGIVVALFAGLTPINVVGEMTSIGTLFAFVVVCSAVITLRIKRPEARRPFEVPFGYVFPVLGVVSCLYLMLSLSAVTWVRFLVWLDIGMMIYWFYGRTHSPLADRAEQAAQTGTERGGNVLTMLGALGLFNGFFMTVLGGMTELGITTEATTKWHEIHVTPHEADTVGLAVLAAGAAMFLAGRMVARSGRRPAAPS